MNLLRALLSPFDRRQAERRVEDDKRTGKLAQLHSVNGRINSAIEELDKTLSMTREEWLKSQQDQQK